MENLVAFGIGIAILTILMGIAIRLLIGMVVVWPLSLILIMLGGFTGGGVGALIGGGLSGIVGMFAESNR